MTTKSPSIKQIEDALIELYLNVKVRNNDEIDEYSTTQFTTEKSKLKSVGTMQLIEYIRQSIEILTNMKYEELDFQQKNKQNKNNDTSIDIGKGEQSDYEDSLQKLEAEVRSHIRIEQQLKIYADNLQSRNEELEAKIKQSEDEKKSISKLQSEIRDKEKCNDELKSQIQSLKRKIDLMEKETKLFQSKTSYDTDNHKSQEAHKISPKEVICKPTNDIFSPTMKCAILNTSRPQNKVYDVLLENLLPKF